MTTPKVLIEDEVYRKIMYWVNKSDLEVSGLGTVLFDKEANAFRVKSAMLLPQENAATHTEIKPEAICKAMYELIHAEGELKFWWHSHVNMSVFWSGTDMDTIKQIGENGWVLASVFNKKREVKSAFHSVDYHFPLFMDSLPTEIVTQPDERETAWDEEYKKNVTTKVFQPVHPVSTRAWTYPENRGWTTRDTTANGNTATRYTEQEIADALIVGRKPAGMPKKEWKAWKKRSLDMQASDDAPEPYIHPYPFTQAELTQLAAAGVDQEEVDTLIRSNWDREEILEILTDNPHLLGDDMLLDDDIPVADRRWS